MKCQIFWQPTAEILDRRMHALGPRKAYDELSSCTHAALLNIHLTLFTNKAIHCHIANNVRVDLGWLVWFHYCCWSGSEHNVLSHQPHQTNLEIFIEFWRSRKSPRKTSTHASKLAVNQTNWNWNNGGMLDAPVNPPLMIRHWGKRRRCGSRLAVIPDHICNSEFLLVESDYYKGAPCPLTAEALEQPAQCIQQWYTFTLWNGKECTIAFRIDCHQLESANDVFKQKTFSQ